MELRTSDLALIALADRAEARELCRQLTHCGWQVLSAQDGAAARAALWSRPVALAVIAARLPMMGGLEVVASARAAGWRGSAVLIDATDRAEARQEAATLGAIAYLVQPVRSQSLWPVLQRLRKPPASARAVEHMVGADRATGFRPGTRLRVALGPRADSHEAVVTEVSAASLEIAVQGAGVPLPSAHLGAAVQVGFASSRGWGEFSSRVIGSYSRAQFTEVTLSVPDCIAYHQRRRCARLRAAFPLDVWPAAGSGGLAVSVPGQVEDIALAGLRASLYAAVPVTEFMNLEIDLGSEAALQVAARPVWYQPPSDAQARGRHRYGFQFVAPSRCSRGDLRRLLRQLRRAPEGPDDRSGVTSVPVVCERGPHAHCATD